MKRIVILFTIGLSLCWSARAFQGGGGEPTKTRPPVKKKVPASKPTRSTPPPVQSRKRTPPRTSPSPKGVTAKLTIEVNEPESEIILTDKNGELVFTGGGQAVSVDKLRAGLYTLTVRKTGYIVYRRQVSIGGAAVKVDVLLQPAIAYLTLSCTNVPDALIEVDGVGRFTGGVMRQPVKPGSYRVTMSRKGFVSSSETVEISTPGVEINLIRSLAAIPVNSMIADGVAALAARDFDKAEKIGRDVLDFEPENGKAALLVGSALFEKGAGGSVSYLMTALRRGEIVSIEVHIYLDSGEKRILDARLTFDRDNMRLEVPSSPTQNFWVFKPDFRGIQSRLDKQNLTLVVYQGRGDNGNGKKLDRTINIYSPKVYLKAAGRDKVTFCQQTNSTIAPRCDADAQNLHSLIVGWQTQLR